MPSGFEQIASLLVGAFGLSGGGTADRAQQVLLILTAFRPHERGFAEFLDTLKEAYADEPRKRLTSAWLCSGSYWPSRFAPRVFPKQCHGRQRQFSGVASRFYKTYMVRRTSKGIVQNVHHTEEPTQTFVNINSNTESMPHNPHVFLAGSVLLF